MQVRETSDATAGLLVLVVAFALGLTTGFLAGSGVLALLEEKTGAQGLSEPFILTDRYATSHAWLDGTRCALFYVPRADGVRTIVHCADGRFGVTDGTYGGVVRLFPERGAGDE